MAIGAGETAYFNLYDGTGGDSLETGVNSSNDDTTNGELTGLDDLVDTNNDATGTSVEHDNTTDARVGQGNGREAGDTQTDEDINDQGMFQAVDTNPFDWTIKFSTSHPDVKVHIFTCTTYTSQEENECTVTGSSTSVPSGLDSMDATFNTAGTVFSSADFIELDVNDELLLSLENPSSGTFFFFNGAGFEVESGGGGGGPTVVAGSLGLLGVGI